MKYMGSKNRIAKHLLPIMLENRNGRTWVEPFVGGANMIDKVGGKRIGADLNEYVISLLNQMSKPGFKAPEISEEKYKDIKAHESQYPRYMVGYAATQLSYGGKWFGGYRRDKIGVRDYCKEAQNNVNKQSENLQGVEFIHSSYQNLEIPSNSLIYCDPPYEGTTKYKDDFNHTDFWEWCRTKTKEGHQVFISEYNAPSDFKSIYSKEVNSSLTKDTGSKKANEQLFVYCA
jgi:DNA adenine methylase